MKQTAPFWGNRTLVKTTNSREQVGQDVLPRVLRGSWEELALSVLDESPIRDEENALTTGSLVLYPLPFGWKDRPRFSPRPLRIPGCISAPVACGDGMLSLSPRALIHGMMMVQPIVSSFQGTAWRGSWVFSLQAGGRTESPAGFQLCGASIPGLWRDGLHLSPSIDLSLSMGHSCAHGQWPILLPGPRLQLGPKGATSQQN